MLFNAPLTNQSDSFSKDFLERNADGLRKIELFADLSEGLTIGFVEINLERDRDATVQYLTTHGQSDRIQWIPLLLDSPDLRYLMRAIEADLESVTFIPDRKPVLLLCSLEHAIGRYGDYPDILSNINIARDDYPLRLPYPILFLLPSYAITRFARFAPDFWDWKSMEVRLESDIAVIVEDLSSYIATIEPDAQIEISSLKRPFPQERLDFLLSMLPKYPEPSVMRADLLDQLGDVYASYYEFDKAEPLYQQALELKQQLHHPDVATTLNNLATTLNNLALLYKLQGRYEEAEPLYKKALELNQQQLGDLHPDVATSFTNLAVLYYAQGRYEDAEPCFQQALQLRQQQLDDLHPDVATSLTNLAVLYYAQGKYEEAEPLYKQALQLRQQLLGDRHPNVAATLNNLAELYKSQGRYEDAKPLFQKALELRQQLLGDRHPNVAATLNNLAELYKSQGRYKEARLFVQQVLEVYQEMLGDVATSVNNLAVLYHAQSRYEEAEQLYQQELELRQLYQQLELRQQTANNDENSRDRI
jgi:tetratricopeptide (TPR) repeat protein